MKFHKNINSQLLFNKYFAPTFASQLRDLVLKSTTRSGSSVG